MVEIQYIMLPDDISTLKQMPKKGHKGGKKGHKLTKREGKVLHRKEKRAERKRPPPDEPEPYKRTTTFRGKKMLSGKRIGDLHGVLRYNPVVFVKADTDLEMRNDQTETLSDEENKNEAVEDLEVFDDRGGSSTIVELLPENVEELDAVTLKNRTPMESLNPGKVPESDVGANSDTVGSTAPLGDSEPSSNFLSERESVSVNANESIQISAVVTAEEPEADASSEPQQSSEREVVIGSPFSTRHGSEVAHTDGELRNAVMSGPRMEPGVDVLSSSDSDSESDFSRRLRLSLDDYDVSEEVSPAEQSESEGEPIVPDAEEEDEEQGFENQLDDAAFLYEASSDDEDDMDEATRDYILNMSDVDDDEIFALASKNVKKVSVDDDFDYDIYDEWDEHFDKLLDGAEPTKSKQPVSDRKKMKRQARELLHQLKFGKQPELWTRYPEQITVTEVLEEIRSFARDKRQNRIKFPPMDNNARWYVKEIAMRHGIWSTLEGRKNEKYIVCSRTNNTMVHAEVGNLINRRKLFKRTDTQGPGVKSKNGAVSAAGGGASARVRDGHVVGQHASEIPEDNFGYQLMKQMGWTEGLGLGREKAGISAPIPAIVKLTKTGLGS